jgi:hypothetical protein
MHTNPSLTPSTKATRKSMTHRLGAASTHSHFTLISLSFHSHFTLISLSFHSHIGLIKGSPHSLLPASGCPFIRLIYDILGLGIRRGFAPLF